MQVIGVRSYLQSIVAASHMIGIRYDKPLAYSGCFAGNRGSSYICAATQVMEILYKYIQCPVNVVNCEMDRFGRIVIPQLQPDHLSHTL